MAWLGFPRVPVEKIGGGCHKGGVCRLGLPLSSQEDIVYIAGPRPRGEALLVGGGAGLRQSPQMLLLFWQLVAPIGRGGTNAEEVR